MTRSSFDVITVVLLTSLLMLYVATETWGWVVALLFATVLSSAWVIVRPTVPA